MMSRHVSSSSLFYDFKENLCRLKSKESLRRFELPETPMNPLYLNFRTQSEFRNIFNLLRRFNRLSRKLLRLSNRKFNYHKQKCVLMRAHFFIELEKIAKIRDIAGFKTDSKKLREIAQFSSVSIEIDRVVL